MRKTIVLLFLIIISSSVVLFASSSDSWVGASFMGDYETTLNGGGAGVSFSAYFFGNPVATGNYSKGRNSTVSYSSSIPVYTGSTNVYDSSYRHSTASVSSGGKKIGFMAQFSMLGEAFDAYSSDSAGGFYSFISFGMAMRQYLSNTVTLYEGIGLGTVFATGDVTTTVSGSRYYRYYDYDTYSYRENYLGRDTKTETNSFSTYGLGLSFDIGAKWDFHKNFSLIGGMTTQILWAPMFTSSSYYSSYTPSTGYYTEWDSSYSDFNDVSFLVGFQPYVGVSYNF